MNLYTGKMDVYDSCMAYQTPRVTLVLPLAVTPEEFMEMAKAHQLSDIWEQLGIRMRFEYDRRDRCDMLYFSGPIDLVCALAATLEKAGVEAPLEWPGGIAEA